MSDKEMDVVRKGASSKEIRQARLKSLVRRLALWVVVPTLLGILYFGLVAAPQFDSVALIRVESAAGGVEMTKSDSLWLKEFAESRTMHGLLNQELEFDAHYSVGGDVLTRLSSSASQETAYDYYRGKVELEYHVESRVLKLTVRAFSGKEAQAFATAILRFAENIASTSDEHGHQVRLNLADERVRKTKSQLMAEQLALSSLMMSPSTELSVEETANLEMVRYRRDLARSSYETALVAVDKLAEDVVKEQRYIAVISPPSAPSGSSHPRRLWGILTVFVLSFALMGVFSMLGAALKEHARF